MTQVVLGVTVLVASPGDALPERGIVRDRLVDWNIERGRREQVHLAPWLWERHATAEVGGRPQAIINRQAVDQADVVVAFFDSRLGSSTGVDVSGTAEEIRRAHELGKPVHVYFSNEPIPRDADMDQLAALREFKEELATNALLGEYSDPADLAGQVIRAIERDIEQQGGECSRRAEGDLREHGWPGSTSTRNSSRAPTVAARRSTAPPPTSSS